MEEITSRLAKILGRVVDGLYHFDMHKLYIDKTLQFYGEICRHKDVEMRK